MGADLLSSPTPARLICRRGRWSLELTRLVAVDSNVFQPRRQELDGSDAILSHLKRSADNPNLAQAAAQLMRSLRADEERSFDAVEGEWVPSQLARVSQTAPHPVSPPRQDLEDALAELRAEFLILRASHERLKRRVVTLEAELLHGGRPEGKPERAVRAQPSLASFPPEPPLRPAVSAPLVMPAVAAPLEQPTLTTGREPDPAPESPILQPYGGVVPARVKEEEAPPGISLGPEAQLVQALTDLFSGDPGYAVSQEPLPDSALELAALYGSLLVDDDGREVGAVLADIRATANLGGRLSGLPATVIEEQAKTGVLSETVTAAMSEVCNTLAHVLSRVANNGHVRSTPLESYPAERLTWVGTARSCVALEKFRGGTFWIVAR